MAEQYPKTAVSQALGVRRSSLYYQPHTDESPALQSAIREVCAQFPCYGYRRVTAELHRQHWHINRKRVARLMAAMGLQARKVVRKRRTTNSQHPFPRYPNLVQDRVVHYPDEVWVADITYVRLKHGFVYLAVRMDVCTHAIRGWHLGRTLEQALTLEALLKAFATQHCPHIHHSDQGVQYAATDYVAILQEHKIESSMSRTGNPYDNAKAERFMRTLKYEEIYMNDYETLAEVRASIEHFIETVYNRKRLHSAIGYRPPVEFEASLAQLKLP